MNEHTYLSDQALVAQLARVEDEIGTTATFATDDGSTRNADLLDLLAREVGIVTEIRRRLVSAKAVATA